MRTQPRSQGLFLKTIVNTLRRTQILSLILTEAESLIKI